MSRMIDAPYEIQFELLHERSVARAKLLVEIGSETSSEVAVLDADNNDFVRLGGLPERSSVETISLSNDGTKLLASVRQKHSRLSSFQLIIHELDTGIQKFYATSGGGYLLGSISPDGNHIAALNDTSSEDAQAALDVIKVSTGERESVWTGDGWWETERAVNWSPDGSLVAATYLNANDELATLIIDPVAKIVQGMHVGYGLIQSSHGSWLANRELMVYSENEAELTSINIEKGSRRNFAWPSDRRDIFKMVYNRRLVWKAYSDPYESDRTLLYSTNLEGRDRQDFIIIRPVCGTISLDVAPGVR